ncbi:tail fiber protein [Escherichia phage BubbaBully]
MAIYRKGQASMDAQGYITGYDTKWREQLSLIRPGATIFFIDAPFQAAVISEVISDTQIRAITTGGAEIGRSNYIILLHDSITVDGLAQDVAETLRYYQSKETQIEEAIEFFKNFDLKALQDLVNQVKGDAEKTAANLAATEQLKNDTQQIKDSAVAETNQIKADTDAIKAQTEQIKDSAVAETNQIKADTDAIKAQTEQIKDSAVTETEAIKQEAFGARDQAELARDAAGNHAADANNAKSGAETARDEARQLVQQVQPENLLHKDQNLNDLANKDLAREALKVDRFNQGDGETFIHSPDKIKYLTVGNDGWGYWNTASQQFIPLGVQQGGTGATNISQARNNFGIGEADIPVFRGVHLIEKNGANSGLIYLTNRHANGNDVSNSRIYNEIKGGLSKTTIHTFRPGGGNSYLQIDERGYLSNFSSLAIGMSDHVLGANAIAIGDSDSGLRWSSDGVIQAVSDGQNIIAWTPEQLAAYKPITSYAPENTRFAYVEGTRTGSGSFFIGGKLQAGSFSAWRDRATGVLCEIPSHDAAISIFKAVHWGHDWITGLDCVNWSAGGAETHLYVKGADFIFNNAGGAVCNQWVSTSDIRMKANLKEIETASDKIDYLTGYTYYKRNNLIEDENSVYSIEAGLIAQDVERVLPEAVHSLNNDGEPDPKGEAIKGVNYNGVVALLVNAFKEQKEIVNKQQEEIDNLKAEIEDLKLLIKALQ